MGRLIEKMYGSYSDADLNDWERLPLNSRVLTSSAFGAWLLRRDERRDKAIPKADYEARLKADMVAMLTEILTDFDNLVEPNSTRIDCESIVEQKIQELEGKSDGEK